MVMNGEVFYDLGVFLKSDFVKLQNLNGMNCFWNENIDKFKLNIDYDMGYEVFNQLVLFVQNLNILLDILNIQLLEFVKSVVECLGN